MSRNPYFGAKGDSFDERDYQLAAGIVELPKPAHTFYDQQNTYEQNLVSPMSCTIHAAIGAASDLLGIRFNTSFIQSLWEYAKTRGASDTEGYYVDKAVQDVRKKVNEVGIYPEILSFRLTLCSEEFWQAIDAGYSVATGYRGNADYNKDFLTDGILDGTDFGSLTYGHSLRFVKDKDSDEIKVIVDNYPERKFNVYKIKRETLQKLWENQVFFTSGYVFATRESFVQPQLKVSDWAVKSVEKAKAKNVATHWDNPQEIIGTATLEQILFNLGGLTQLTGNGVTKERLIVALDNLKLLN